MGSEWLEALDVFFLMEILEILWFDDVLEIHWFHRCKDLILTDVVTFMYYAYVFSIWTHHVS